MKVKITRNAAKVIKKQMELEGNSELKLRVAITHAHGDHAHYGLDLDTPKENDVVVSTDKEIDVILDPSQPLLDGVVVDYCIFHKKVLSLRIL